jgi:hypothetical protein
VARSLGPRWHDDSTLARQSLTGGQRDLIEGGLNILEHNRAKQDVREILTDSRE